MRPARDLMIDQINSVSLGGRNDPQNLQTLYRDCNVRMDVRV